MEQQISDQTLEGASRELLLEEVKKLRAAIRAHRNERGHDRCWLDDMRLYATLPEGAPAPQELRLPAREEFLRNCERYHECRQPKRD